MNGELLLDIGLYMGFVASVITSVAYLPGAVKTIQTHDTRGISWIMFFMTVIRSFIWFAFGMVCVFIWDKGINTGLPIVLVNCIISPCSLIIFFIKIKNLYLAKKNNTTENEIVVKILKEKRKW